MLKECPTCETEPEETSDYYCKDCGTQLTTIHCNWCNRAVPTDIKYCAGCGRSRKEALTTKPSCFQALIYAMFDVDLGRKKRKAKKA